MTNEEFEPIRIRIMKEAYDLSDKDDAEGFNAIKVMCGDIQNFLQRTWVGLTDEELKNLFDAEIDRKHADYLCFARAVEAKLRSKNT